VAYCQMLDSVPSVETCSSLSSSESSSSEFMRASPPPIPDLGDIMEMPKVEVTHGMVPVETEAHAASLIGEFLCVCMFRMLCGAFVSYMHLDVDYAGARGDDDDGDAGFGRWFRGNHRLELWMEMTFRLFSASNMGRHRLSSHLWRSCLYSLMV
jgi:hypothetical protein